jgi:ABC-type transporter Mla subunit MlaD
MDTGVEQPKFSHVLGKHPSLTIAAVAVAAVVLMVAITKPPAHRLEFKCYFKDARGLRAGDKVRLAGVEVGSVTSVRVRPELREHPAEAIMVLQTSYPLSVPDDSIVTVETAGVLGQAFAKIDIKDTSGPPLQAGGVLKTSASQSSTLQQWLECLSKLAAHKPCELQNQGEAGSLDPASSPERK